MSSKKLINIFKGKINNKNIIFTKIYQKQITLYLKNSFKDKINHVTFTFFQIGKNLI